MSFELRQELHGHTADVRCACVLKSDNTTIITGSRDRSIRLWKLASNSNEYEVGTANFDHPHWVNALESLPQGFATGCHDHLVRLFDESCNMIASLGGHTGPVSSLSLLSDKNTLASGSWDGSARIWDIEKKTCIRVLGNHENMVCVLGLPNGMLATGSTGMQQGNTVVGFKVRLFGPTGSEPLSVIQAHEGPIRCLTVLTLSKKFAFASASNDGSVVLYGADGSLLNKLINPPGFEGTPAFNFCVQSLIDKYDQIITASDDCCARIWDCESSRVIQEIEHPATVWWVICLPNGDLCTCSGDGVVRLFSSDPIRQSPDTELVTLFRETARASREAQKKKVSPQMDISKLARIQDAPAGASDQQVRVFNKDGAAVAYQWSALMGTWIEIGVVTSGGGDGPDGKTELDGQYYDRVVPVEIQDVRTAEGGMMKLKLGFNSTDNPYVVANAFVKKHELPDHYVEEIVQFINQQRGSSAVPTITSTSNVSSTLPSTSAPVVPTKSSSFFPLRDSLGYMFEKGDAEKAVAKIKELNTAQPLLQERDIADLDGVLAILKATSKYHATQFSDSQIKLIANKLTTAWSYEDRFAVYDLARAVLTHPDGGDKLSGKLGEQFFIQACITGASTEAPNPLVLTSLRAACNMFRYPRSNQAALIASCDASTTPIQLIADSPKCKDASANVRLAIATLFLNCANALYHRKGRTDRDLAVVAQITRGATALLTSFPELDDDAAVRAVSALGCCGLIEPQVVKNSTMLVNNCSGQRVKAIWKDVTNIL